MAWHNLERTLRLIARILALPVAAVIVYFSIVPDPVRIETIDFLDKLKHVVAYGTLGLLAALAFATQANKWKVLILAAIACAALGGALEIIQGYVSRSPDVIDWLCDLAGALVGGLVALGVSRLLTKKEP